MFADGAVGIALTNVDLNAQTNIGQRNTFHVRDTTLDHRDGGVGGLLDLAGGGNPGGWLGSRLGGLGDGQGERHGRQRGDEDRAQEVQPIRAGTGEHGDSPGQGWGGQNRGSQRDGGADPTGQKFEGGQQGGGVGPGLVGEKFDDPAIAAGFLQVAESPLRHPDDRVPPEERRGRQFEEPDQRIAPADVDQFMRQDRRLRRLTQPSKQRGGQDQARVDSQRPDQRRPGVRRHPDLGHSTKPEPSRQVGHPRPERRGGWLGVAESHGEPANPAGMNEDHPARSRQPERGEQGCQRPGPSRGCHQGQIPPRRLGGPSRRGGGGICCAARQSWLELAEWGGVGRRNPRREGVSPRQRGGDQRRGAELE